MFLRKKTLSEQIVNPVQPTSVINNMLYNSDREYVLRLT